MSYFQNLTQSNPGSSYYALATQTAENWYNYPAADGIVIFTDASGNHNLESVAGDLYFDGELLAKAGEATVDQWSDYPQLFPLNSNGFPIQNVSEISGVTASFASITSSGDISSNTLHTVTANAASISVTGQASVGGLQTTGGITGGSVSVSGNVATATLTAGSITASGGVSAASATVTAGLNMTNSAITNAASIAISNAGLGPYGSLTSPDGVLLTWNGQSITTGGGGNVSQWSSFKALTSVDLSFNNLINVGAVGFTGGSLDTSGTDLVWNGQIVNVGPATDLSQWATLPAVHDVSMNNFSLLGANNITGRAMTIANDIPALGGTIVTVGAPGVVLPGLPNLLTVNGIANVTQVLQAGAVVAPTGSFGSVECNGGGSGALSVIGGLTQTPGENNLIHGAHLGALNVTVEGIGVDTIRIDVLPVGIDVVSATYVTIDAIGAIDLAAGGAIAVAAGGTVTLEAGADVYVQGAAGNFADLRFTNGGGVYNMGNISGNNATGVYIENVNNLVGRVDGSGNAMPIKNVDSIVGTGITGSSLVLGDVSGYAYLLDVYSDISANNSIGLYSDVGTVFLGANTSASLPYISLNDINNAPLGILITTQDPSGNGPIVMNSTGSVSINSNSFVNITTPGIINISSPAATISASTLQLTNIPSATASSYLAYDSVTDEVSYTPVPAFQSLGVSGEFITLTNGGQADVSTTTTVAANTQKLTAITYDAGLLVTTVDGDLTVNDDTILKGNVEVGVPFSFPPKNLTVYASIIPGSITDASGSGGLSGQFLSAGAGDQLKWTSFVKDSTEFYVSAQGSNVTGNGSILFPYQTIQFAITQAELISSAALVCVINVASGHYVENLTFNKGYVILTGSLQSQTGNEVCEVTGSISIAVTGANDLFNRQVTFQGFNITCGSGQAITDTSTSSHTVTFQDCKGFVVNQFFVSTSTAADMRFYMTNVEINQSSAASVLPVVVTNIGLIEFERLDMSVDGNCTPIVVGGTSILSRFSLSSLDSANAAATLLPLLSITSTTTSTHTLGNVAFSFTSVVAKTATNAMNIASSINTAILMLNCVFTLGGTASSTNNCIGYNGVGSPTIAGINNTSLNVNVLLPQTTSVQSGITQIQYTDIQPPGLASYSSTIDQAIAVAGTPQALTYNTTQFNQGTTLVASSRVYANAQGNYAINYIVQLSNTAGSSHDATTFLKKNGATIANTGSQWTLDNAHQMAVAKENIISLNAGDYVEVFFNATATGVAANATAAAGALPAIPSVVFNIKQFR